MQPVLECMQTARLCIGTPWPTTCLEFQAAANCSSPWAVFSCDNRTRSSDPVDVATTYTSWQHAPLRFDLPTNYNTALHQTYTGDADDQVLVLHCVIFLSMVPAIVV